MNHPRSGRITDIAIATIQEVSRPGTTASAPGRTESCAPHGDVADSGRHEDNTGGSRHRLEIKLIGTTSNRDAVGARITAGTGAPRQLREARCGSAYVSGQRLVQPFGLGAAADTIEVRWPAGAVTLMYHVPVDQRLTITEGETG